jgi:coenzyme PQQ precursor peptide PqqA
MRTLPVAGSSDLHDCPARPENAPEGSCSPQSFGSIIQVFKSKKWEDAMAWTTPVLVEICIGLEINGYMPADGSVPPEF